MKLLLVLMLVCAGAYVPSTGTNFGRCGAAEPVPVQAV